MLCTEAGLSHPHLWAPTTCQSLSPPPPHRTGTSICWPSFSGGKLILKVCRTPDFERFPGICPPPPRSTFAPPPRTSFNQDHLLLIHLTSPLLRIMTGEDQEEGGSITFRIESETCFLFVVKSPKNAKWEEHLYWIKHLYLKFVLFWEFPLLLVARPITAENRRKKTGQWICLKLVSTKQTMDLSSFKWVISKTTGGITWISSKCYHHSEMQTSPQAKRHQPLLHFTPITSLFQLL